MPREIIAIPEFTRMRYEAQEAKTEAIASIPQSIAQALLTYSQMKNKDELERIAIYDHMLATYKDQMPQAAMADYDRVLRGRYKVGLPKDPATGDFMLPSPTVDDLIAREARNNPQLMADAVRHKLGGKTSIEQQWHDEDMAAKRAHEHRLEATAQANAEVNKARALEAANKNKQDDAPSDIVQMPDGSLKQAAEVFNQETGEFPPGAVMLSGKQADRAIKLMSARSQEGYRQAEIARINSQLEVDKAKLKNYIAFGPGAAQWNILKNIWANPKTTDEMREAIKPQIVDLMRHADVKDENIAKFLEGSKPNDWQHGFIAQFFTAAFGSNGLGPQIEKEQAQKGLPTPEVGGQRRVSSGKVFTVEEVPATQGDDYETRMKQLGMGGRDMVPETAAPSAAPRVGAETDFVSPGPKTGPVQIPKGTVADIRKRAEQIPDTKTRLKIKALADRLELDEERYNNPAKGLTKYTEEETRSLMQSINELFAGVR